MLFSTLLLKLVIIIVLVVIFNILLLYMGRLLAVCINGLCFCYNLYDFSQRFYIVNIVRVMTDPTLIVQEVIGKAIDYNYKSVYTLVGTSFLIVCLIVSYKLGLLDSVVSQAGTFNEPGYSEFAYLCYKKYLNERIKKVLL